MLIVFDTLKINGENIKISFLSFLNLYSKDCLKKIRNSLNFLSKCGLNRFRLNRRYYEILQI